MRFPLIAAGVLASGLFAQVPEQVLTPFPDSDITAFPLYSSLFFASDNNGQLGDDWRVANGGQYVFDAATGSASLQVEFISGLDAADRLFFTLTFDTVVPGGATPVLSYVQPSALASAGGPLDPSTWTYFANLDGTMTGAGRYEGLVADIDPKDVAQVGDGASLRNEGKGLSSWLEAFVSQQPPGCHVSSRVDIELFLNLGTPEIQCVDNLMTEDRGLWLNIPGFDNHWRIETGATMVENADGSMVMSGEAVNVGDPSLRLCFEATGSGRVDPTDPNYPPAGSPKIDSFFTNNNFDINQGGRSDVSGWRYYENLDGVFTGKGALDGAELTFTRRGPSAQFGVGANLRTQKVGLSAWIDVTIVQQPTTGTHIQHFTAGDFNIEVNNCVLCPSNLTVGQDFRGIWINGDLYRFLNGGEFRENMDGTATLRATVALKDDFSQRFCIDVEFSNAVLPGASSHPPAGSPKTNSLVNNNLFSNGGPIDLDTWRYYENFTGTFTGKGSLEGAELSVSRRGEAFQIGAGANLKEVSLGASGWFDVHVVSQPNSGQHLSYLNGDFNFNLDLTCVALCPPELFSNSGPHALKTVTKDCFEFHGDCIENLAAVQFGQKLITSQNPLDLRDGYFTPVDHDTVQICPPQCLAAGTYDVTLIGVNGSSHTLQVQLDRPTTPVLSLPTSAPVSTPFSVFVHIGDQPSDAFPFLVISPINSPSQFLPIFDFDIGGNFSNFMVLGAMGECVEFSFGGVPALVQGHPLFFQGGAFSKHVPLPMPTSMVCTIQF